MPRLSDLLAALPAGLVSLRAGDTEREITGVTADSRNVQQGFLFCAIAGASEDGGRYIDAALARGAAAVLVAAAADVALQHSALLQSTDVRLAYALLCASFWPQQPAACVAVTGTNGKTSVAEFYRQLWVHAGVEAASIGTLGLTRSSGQQDAIWPSGNTSPAAEILHPALQQLAQQGVQHVALEASSHGLDQRRLHGVRLAATAFTNFTQDHLDYHHTMQAYFEAKALLFSDFTSHHLPPPAGGGREGGSSHAADDAPTPALPRKQGREWLVPAILNADNEAGQQLLAQFPQAKSYGARGTWLQLLSASPTPQGLQFTLRHQGEDAQFNVPLYGTFQIENIMAASGLALLTGMSWQQCCAGIQGLRGVRGRMEQVATHPCGAPIFIDYAHTPDALKHLLISLSAHCTGKLHLVFGCGGDRDRSKRAPMGSIAAQYAGRVIVTDDNPRSEDPLSIRRQILEAAPQAIEIADRAHAIEQAIRALGAGDLLVVAGKGHETYQIIGDKTYEFNDAQQIKEALGAL